MGISPYRRGLSFSIAHHPNEKAREKTGTVVALSAPPRHGSQMMLQGWD
jgi:hypothetical protein